MEQGHTARREGRPATAELLVRLRRVEGQVRGIQRMVERGERCVDVLTQIAAARAALDAAGLAVLDARLHDCLDRVAADGDRDAGDLVAAVERFVRR